MVESIYSVILTILDFFQQIPTYFAWLPEPASLAISAICAVALTFRVLGWGD